MLLEKYDGEVHNLTPPSPPPPAPLPPTQKTIYIKPSGTVVQVMPGDVVVLGSDGLFDNVTDEAILQVSTFS